MPPKKTVTKLQLKKIQEEAFAVIKAWVRYLDALNDYQLKTEKVYAVRDKTSNTKKPKTAYSTIRVECETSLRIFAYELINGYHQNIERYGQ